MDNEDEMLEELKKIRTAVEKAPEPAPSKGLWVRTNTPEKKIKT